MLDDGNDRVAYEHDGGLAKDSLPATLYALLEQGAKRRKLCLQGDTWEDATVEGVVVLTTTGPTKKRRMLDDGNERGPKRARVHYEYDGGLTKP